MQRSYKLLLLLIPTIILISCDAMLHMTYTVENKTKNDIKIFVPNFPSDSIVGVFGKKQDTTFILKSNEKVVVGMESKVDFPWATKNIYKKKPGFYGIKIINDTIINLGCTKAEWKYKRRNSNIKIKTNR